MTQPDDHGENPDTELESPIESQTPPRNGVKQRRRPSRRALTWGGAVLALLLLVAGFRYIRYAMAHESTDDAFLDGHIIPISPRVSGHVAKVYVTDNQKVAAGDLLASLDQRDFQARLDAAGAALHAAEAAYRSRDIDVNLTSISTTAGLDEAKAAVVAAQAMVQNARALAAGAKSQQGEAQAQVAVAKAALDQARAELTATEAKYQQAAQDLKRYKELASSNTISPQQLEHAATAANIAAADLTAAKRNLPMIAHR